MINYDARRNCLYQPHLTATVFNETLQNMDDWVCAELSRLAYTPFERDATQNARLLFALQAGGFEWIEGFCTDSTQAFAVRLRATGRAVLVFRGTEPDAADFATDISTWKTPWNAGSHVHQGFANALDSVWDKIERALGSSLRNCIFTGHSLGGALATLAASQVQSSQTRLVTIGSPAVGDQAFAQSLAGSDVQRYVNCCDIICTLPPAWLGFAHVGALRYVDAAGQLRTPAPSHEAIEQDQSAARRAYWHDAAWKVGTVVLRDLADHAPVNYIRALMPD
jgi:pimeloyl-ACP methyl ester carboxylesterase